MVVADMGRTPDDGPLTLLRSLRLLRRAGRQATDDPPTRLTRFGGQARGHEVASDEQLGCVVEPAKERPVAHDVDVVVAGSGLCGTFTAIAAGRCGAKTLLIERYGTLGGNIGPGMVVAGGLDREADTTLPGGMAGIAGEFMDRLKPLRAREEAYNPEEAGIAAHLAYEMAQEAGVEILLQTTVSDPIAQEGIVRGLFVESASSRVAVKAKVTVDGTGVGAIARRAGAAMVDYLEPSEEYAEYIRPPYLRKDDGTYYNDTGLLCAAAGIDRAAYEAFVQEDAALSDEDAAWAEKRGMLAGPPPKGYPKGLIAALRRSDDDGSFRPRGEIEPGVRISMTHQFGGPDGTLGSFAVICTGAVDAGDHAQVSRIEGAMRAQAFKTVAFYRANAPGFEKAYQAFCAPFLGWRGGPHIEGEHTLTPGECFSGALFDDVLYRNIHEHEHGGAASGFDVPYRITLPKEIDGLLVCGRGAAYLRRGHDPSGMRARPSMMVFGQCVGTAAAVAAQDRATPRMLDIKRVQRRLVEDGIFLGEQNRLTNLGLL